MNKKEYVSYIHEQWKSIRKKVGGYCEDNRRNTRREDVCNTDLMSYDYQFAMNTPDLYRIQIMNKGQESRTYVYLGTVYTDNITPNGKNLIEKESIEN